MRSAPAILALAALAACAAPPTRAPGLPGPRATQGSPTLAALPRPTAFPTAEATATGAELDFVAGVLADLNPRSVALNREVCGYLGLDATGALATTPVVTGGEASCALPRVPPGFTVLASFHTHSAYSPRYASEWPTTQDVATDAADNIDGYIATPGGRLWHVDTDTMTVRDLCGRGCLPADPAYVAADDGPLRPVMTFADLQRWERGQL